MRLVVEPFTLQLKTPFRIAHGVSTARYNVLVQLGEGVGEAALMPYAGYSQAEIVAWRKRWTRRHGWALRRWPWKMRWIGCPPTPPRPGPPSIWPCTTTGPNRWASRSIACGG